MLEEPELKLPPDYLILNVANPVAAANAAIENALDAVDTACANLVPEYELRYGDDEVPDGEDQETWQQYAERISRIDRVIMLAMDFTGSNIERMQKLRVELVEWKLRLIEIEKTMTFKTED